MKIEVGKTYVDIEDYDTIFTVVFVGISSIVYTYLDSDNKEVEWVSSIETAEKNWAEYTEPKEKVKLYLYAYRAYEMFDNAITTRYFKDDEDFYDKCNSDYKHIMRLDYTMIEVEEYL